MNLIQIEKKYCQECALWQLLEEKDRESMGVPQNISVGRCAHDGHMSEDTFECIFLNKFCRIDDYNCETCSREDCPLHKKGEKNNGCVNDWRHQLARHQV